MCARTWLRVCARVCVRVCVARAQVVPASGVVRPGETMKLTFKAVAQSADCLLPVSSSPTWTQPGLSKVSCDCMGSAWGGAQVWGSVGRGGGWGRRGADGRR